MVEAIGPFHQQLLAASPQAPPVFYESCIRTFDSDGRGSSGIAFWMRLMIASLYAQRSDFARASANFRELRARANPDGSDFSTWLQAAIGLANAELEAGNHEQALVTAREAEERASRRFGPEHIAVFHARAIRARALRKSGRIDEAIATYDSAMTIGARLPANQAPALVILRIDYGTFLMEQCRFDDAKRELQSGIDGMIAVAGPANPEVARALQRLATTETLRGDWLAAQPIAQRAVRAIEDTQRSVGAADPRTVEWVIESQTLLADVYLATQRNGDAKAMLARAVEVARERPNPTRDADLRSREAEVEAALGAEERARAIGDDALELASGSAVMPLATADVRVRVAEVALRRGDFARAESLVTQAIPVIEKSIAPEARMLRAQHALARAQDGLGKSELALATIERARQVSTKCFGTSSPRLAALAVSENALLAKLGRDAELDASRVRLDEMERARREAPGNQSPGSANLEDAEMNVAFVAPGPAWIEVPAKGTAEKRIRGYRRAAPAMNLVLQAYGVDGPAELTDAEIRAHAFDYSTKEAAGVRVREILRTPRVIAGVEGTQTSEEWTMNSRKELRVRWVGVRGGWQYSLLLASDQTDLGSLLVEAKQMFAGFSPLDPSRVAARTPAVRTFHSQRFGYSFDVSDRNMVVKDHSAGPKRAEVIAAQERRDDARADLYVIPVALGSAARDPELVEAALLRLIQPRVIEWGEPRVVDAFGARGRERDGRFDMNGRPSQVRARVFQRDGVGWAIGATVEGYPEAGANAQLRVAEAVKLTAATVAPEPSTWTELERFRHALLQNELGLAYVAANQPARAIECFQRSLELGPGDALVVTENLAQSQLDTGQFREAARGLDEALAANPDRVSLLALRGTALRRAGNSVAAERDLRRAVDNGNASPIVFGEWLGTLFELGRGDEALAAADQRLAKSGAAEDRVTRAFVLVRLGRNDEAIAELSVIAREHPGDAGVEQLLLGVALLSGEPQALLAATDRLLASAGPAPLLLALRGEALRELGRFDEALVALDEALKLAPDAAEIRALRGRVERERSSAAGKRT